MSVIKIIKDWYRGPHAKPSTHPDVIICGYDPHWTAIAARRLLGYLRHNYKWLVGVALGVVALFI